MSGRALTCQMVPCPCYDGDLLTGATNSLHPTEVLWYIVNLHVIYKEYSNEGGISTM